MPLYRIQKNCRGRTECNRLISLGEVIMKKDLNVVGARLPMLDAAQKVKGAALFTDDLVLPGMLYGKILRSPVAHARILSIDTSRAEKLNGVKGVVTGNDIPDRVKPVF